MYVANHLSSPEPKKLAKQQTQAKILLRLQAVILAKAGHTAPGISKILLATYRSIQYWIRRYNQRGLEGLKDLRRGGNRENSAISRSSRSKTTLTAKLMNPQEVCGEFRTYVNRFSTSSAYFTAFRAYTIYCIRWDTAA